MGTLESFVERPLRVAASLERGDCGGNYLDACLIVSGLISGIASFVWPGKGGDKLRFVEAWVRFADPGSDAVRVSVPLLRKTLRRARLVKEDEAILLSRAHLFGLGNGSLVLQGEQVDADEDSLIAEAPTVTRSMLRQHSYPTIFYEEVRCKLVHEAELDGAAASNPHTIRTDARISYVNRTVLGPGQMLEGAQRERRIFFHLPWLCELTQTMARCADAALAGRKWLPKPNKWWLEA